MDRCHQSSSRLALAMLLAAGCVDDSQVHPCQQDSDCAGGETCTSTGCQEMEVPEEGAPCTVAEGSLHCGPAWDDPDRTVTLECAGGTYTRIYECSAGLQCAPGGGAFIRCGEGVEALSYAKPGGPCREEGGAVCNFARTMVLSCRGGAWAQAVRCPPSECARIVGADGETRFVGCANMGYSVGDRCRSSTDDAVTCSTDERQILACVEGITELVEDCGEGHCGVVDETFIDCID